MIHHKVKVITVHKTPVYHVVNTKTNVTHTMFLDYETALRKMRELNRMERSKHKAQESSC